MPSPLYVLMCVKFYINDFLMINIRLKLGRIYLCLWGRYEDSHTTVNLIGPVMIKC